MAKLCLFNLARRPKAPRPSQTFSHGFKHSVCFQPSFCHLQKPQKKKLWVSPLTVTSYFRCLKTCRALSGCTTTRIFMNGQQQKIFTSGESSILQFMAVAWPHNSPIHLYFQPNKIGRLTMCATGEMMEPPVTINLSICSQVQVLWGFPSGIGLSSETETCLITCIHY